MHFQQRLCRVFALALLAVISAHVVSAAKDADAVTSLPGWSAEFPSKQYSGYLEVGNGRFLHYWFVESESDPSSDPVVAWFNGGPGCSSLDGYLYEHGPFHVNESDHTQLYYNEYTWAKVANMLYIEAPVGVGFSYTTGPLGATNDTRTANENFNALNAFFQAFPEFVTNDFYISGESYAGIYVPTLALRVHNGNIAGQSSINLKGIMVGNGCTGTEVGVCSPAGTAISVDYLHAHGLYSTVLYNKIMSTCKDLSNPDSDCQALLNEMSNEIGNVDIYDIYAPCVSGGSQSNNAKMTSAVPHALSSLMNVGGPDGCIDAIAAGAWLNTKAVQDAIHVSAGAPYFKQWAVCANVNYTPSTPNEPKDIYPTLIANYRVLIFNGDVDACVPYTDNEAWTSGMGYPVKSPWAPWSVNKQVAGYKTVYEVKGGEFQFITVKDSGHMVPQYQPANALEFARRFLSGQPI